MTGGLDARALADDGDGPGGHGKLAAGPARVEGCPPHPHRRHLDGGGVVAGRADRSPSTCSARCGLARRRRPGAKRILDDRLRRTACRRGHQTARRLAFQAYLRDTWHIWTVNADGTGLQAGDVRPFRRSRAALVAGRHAPRLFVRPQRLTTTCGPDARQRRGPPVTTNAANDSSCRRGRPMAGRWPSSRIAPSAASTREADVNAATDRLVVADATTLFTRRRGHRTARPSPMCPSAERSAASRSRARPQHHRCGRGRVSLPAAWAAPTSCSTRRTE